MPVANARLSKGAYEVATLLASTTVATATTVAGSAVALPVAEAYVFVLDVTSAATDADDTLDVQVQTIIDGTNWIPVVSFTQVLGNGGAKRHIAKIMAQTAQAMFEGGAALATGSIRHVFGDSWRVKYVTVDPTGANVSFTFTVMAVPQ